jgi:hypothetical protein
MANQCNTIQMSNNQKQQSLQSQQQNYGKCGTCSCGTELPGFQIDDLNLQRLKEWFTNKRDLILAAITDRARARLLLPRIDTRISNLAKQHRQLEKKYPLPHQRVSARDLTAFGIKYPLENRVYDYQFREHRHTIVRDIDGEPLGGKTPNGEPCDGQEFIEISHAYEPKMYDVRFYLEREIDMAIWHYNRIDRRDYYREFRYDFARLVPKSFPVRDHLHCLISEFMTSS